MKITQERLLQLFSYDPEAGEFTRRVTASHEVSGSIAGSMRPDGYVYVSVDNKKYRRGRLVWLYVHGYWPTLQIDHINRVRSDDRLVNLREVTNAMNQANTGMRAANTSGIRGVSWHSRFNKWCAQYRNVHLGYFHNKDDAAAAVAAKMADPLFVGKSGISNMDLIP